MDTSFPKKLLMTALFQQFPTFTQHKNHIRILHSGQSMRNRNHSSAL